MTKKVHVSRTSYDTCPKKFLYIVSFATEPLIKVGHSCHVDSRVSDLARDLTLTLTRQWENVKNPWIMTSLPAEEVFNFGNSYVFSAAKNCFIVRLESTIKREFKEHRAKPRIDGRMRGNCFGNRDVLFVTLAGGAPIYRADEIVLS